MLYPPCPISYSTSPMIWHSCSNCSHQFKSLRVCISNGIFEYILDRAREPDKLIAKRREVDWHNFPEKLRELIEVRFRYSLQFDDDSSLKYLWDNYFRLGEPVYPFDTLRKIIVSRPRDCILS